MTKGTARQTRRGLGPLGLREEIEPILRRLVAERLGVPATALSLDVSFAQHLAATPVDVTELVVAAERTVGGYVGDTTVDRIRTYGDLVDAIVDARLDAEAAAVPRVWFHSVLVPAKRGPLGVMLRSSWSTPYEIETVLQEARRAGPGACLVIALAPTAPAEAREHLERCFGALVSRGVTVRVRCEWPVRGRAVA